MRWDRFTGTIQSDDGAIAQVKLQEHWEIVEGMEWVARFHMTSPTDVFSEVQTFDNLQGAYLWCKKRLETHERLSTKDNLQCGVDDCENAHGCDGTGPCHAPEQGDTTEEGKGSPVD